METDICGVNLDNPLMNASGVWCTESDQLKELQNSSCGAIISKSCTLQYREGNPKPRYYSREGPNYCISINSMGIPNHGYQYYLDTFKKMKDSDKKKPCSISLSGLSWDENSKLLSIMKDSSVVDWVELNVSCPNLIGKPQLGYDFEGFREVTRKIAEIWDEPYKKCLGLKLPPYFDFVHFEEAADIISDCQPTVRFLTCCNSFGNGLIVDSESESTVIRPKNGFGGIGGKCMKPTGLANVRKFYTLLHDKNVDIIGCGGVMTGTDVFEYILCGANAVQIGTYLNDKGTVIFDTIQSELAELMKQKSYASLNSFRGKLKTIDEEK